ncbi:MAG: hypothetical protein M3P40_08925 [Actinomycetota bacterium]|nr:hypothetical protein [Actinomycetota bacterium]
MPQRRSYPEAEVEAAVQSLSDPAELDQAQKLISANATQLQHIFDEAMRSADWYGSAHQAEVVKAAGTADPDERMGNVRRLVEEESRVSMLIGVAVGFELAHRLIEGQPTTEND